MSGVFAEVMGPAASAVEQAEAVAVGGPTNQQIIDAGRKAYAAHQAGVDAVATAAESYLASSVGEHQATLLNAYNWSEKKVDGTLVTPVWQDPTIAQALETVRADSAILTVVAGILTAGQSDTSQGFGFGSPPNALTSFTGEQFVVAPDLSDPVFGSPTLQIGLWMKAPTALSLDFYGLQAYTPATGQSPVLKIFLLSDLTTYGFSIGLGVAPKLTVALMRGTTNIFI